MKTLVFLYDGNNQITIKYWYVLKKYLATCSTNINSNKLKFKAT